VVFLEDFEAAVSATIIYNNDFVAIVALPKDLSQTLIKKG
jgi:hypothetical protein